MAKDDYFRIVYIILRFLYENMKKGKVNVTLDELMENCNIPDIPKEYFDEILSNLINDGFVDYIGESVQFIHDAKPRTNIASIKIKPKGIEYLEENSMMKKVAEVVKNIKDITPFI